MCHVCCVLFGVKAVCVLLCFMYLLSNTDYVPFPLISSLSPVQNQKTSVTAKDLTVVEQPYENKIFGHIHTALVDCTLFRSLWSCKGTISVGSLCEKTCLCCLRITKLEIICIRTIWLAPFYVCSLNLAVYILSIFWLVSVDEQDELNHIRPKHQNRFYCDEIHLMTVACALNLLTWRIYMA